MLGSLLGSGVLLDGPLEGHSLQDLASIMPGLARRYLFYFILDYLMQASWRASS